jgi:RNA 2',3'-cyclic 3'-phosphodiesterase
LRLFTGLPIPPDAARSLVTSLAPARERFPKARWVPCANLHVTLRFFGDLDDAACAAVMEALDHQELRRPMIACRLGSIGQFPPRGTPRVLWAGLERGAAEVHALWECLSRLLAPLEEQGGPLAGLPREDRDFTAHITVGRSGNSLIRPGWAQGVVIPSLDFEISELILFQSLLGSEGARYVPLKRVPLLKGAS